MGLTAAWRRQGTWAVAATFVVPGALALAVFTVLLGGGFRGLGAVGQVFTGPQVPEARLSAAAVPARPHAARLPVVPVLRPIGGVLVARPQGGAAPSGTRGAAQPATPVATAPPRRSASGPGAAAPAPASPAPAPSPDPQPGSPVRQVGGQVADGVGAAPVVGPTGRQVVTTVVDAVDPPPAVARVLTGR